MHFSLLKKKDVSTMNINTSMKEVDAINKNFSKNIPQEKLYPIYAVLFSNDTKFGKMIRKATGSPYSHATVTLDPSLNDMYSFSDIPFAHDTEDAGFVRESIYSPQYQKNIYFTVLVTFTTKEYINKFKEKLKLFKQNFIRYRYNDAGLLLYYLRFRNTRFHNINKKTKWFCSEFVAYMLYTGNKEEFKDVLQAPEDIAKKKDMITIGDYTLENFSEKDLRRKTKIAYEEYMRTHKCVEETSTDFINGIEYTPLLEANKKIVDGVHDEKEITPYTSLIDWKYLYDKFISIFPDVDPNKRFDLFELIVRNYIVPLKLSAQRTADYIINQMIKIKEAIASFLGTFVGVDTENREIKVRKRNKEVSLLYPELIVKK